MSNLTDLTTPLVQKIAGPLGGLLIKVDIQQVVIAMDRLSVCFGWVVWGSNISTHSTQTHRGAVGYVMLYLFVNVLITNLSLHGEKEDNSKKMFLLIDNRASKNCRANSIMDSALFLTYPR